MQKSALRTLCLVLLGTLATGCSWLKGPPVFVSVKAGETNVMEIDTAGTVHIVYTLNTSTDNYGAVSYVYYATGTPGGSWTPEVLFDGEGSQLFVDAMAVAPDGTVHVLYRMERTVYHAWRLGPGGWADEVFYDDEAGPVGDMTFDANGGMHVCHSGYKTDTLLFDNLRPYYSYKAAAATIATTAIQIGGFAWTDVNHGRQSSIAIDQDGRAHIVYGREGSLVTIPKLYYATVEPGGGIVSQAVEISAIARGTVDNTLTIAPDGTIHVAHLGNQISGGRLVYLSSADGGATWSVVEPVDETPDSGYAPCMRADGAGGLHAAYLALCDGTTGVRVKYAYRADTLSAWSLETVDQDPNPSYYTAEVSLALDGRGSPIVLYPQDTGQGDPGYYQALLLSWKDDAGSWLTQTVRDTSIPE